MFSRGAHDATQPASRSATSAPASRLPRSVTFHPLLPRRKCVSRVVRHAVPPGRGAPGSPSQAEATVGDVIAAADTPANTARRATTAGRASPRERRRSPPGTAPSSTSTNGAGEPSSTPPSSSCSRSARVDNAIRFQASYGMVAPSEPLIVIESLGEPPREVSPFSTTSLSVTAKKRPLEQMTVTVPLPGTGIRILLPST